MIVISIRLVYSCLGQLKFYFGHGRPKNLAAVLEHDRQGTCEDADRLREMLRQQALEYPEPEGPLAGLLHALVPNLIYAPPYLRYLAEWQFAGALTLLVLLISLCLTLVLGVPAQANGQSAVADDIGFVFLAIAVFRLTRPYSIPEADAVPHGFLSVRWLTTVIVLGFVVPILLALLVSDLPLPLIITPFPHVFIILLAGLAAYALFFFALIGQLLPPPVTAVAMIADKWNLSSHPALIIGEFERAMHETWREKIPNRRYCRSDPEIDLTKHAGSFHGQILEETQPFPRSGDDDDIWRLLKRRSSRFCILLDVFGATCMAIGAFEIYLLGTTPLYWGGEDAACFIYAVIFFALARYAYAAAYDLWLRFDYESRLIWLEISGQYTAAKVESGNPRSLRASSNMVQTEAMTFMLWVAELHTVAFGKDAPRCVASMIGNYGIAEALAARLKDFVLNQASVAALGNAANAERLAVISAMGAGAQSKPLLTDSPKAQISIGTAKPDQASHE